MCAPARFVLHLHGLQIGADAQFLSQGLSRARANNGSSRSLLLWRLAHRVSPPLFRVRGRTGHPIGSAVRPKLQGPQQRDRDPQQKRRPHRSSRPSRTGPESFKRPTVAQNKWLSTDSGRRKALTMSAPPCSANFLWWAYEAYAATPETTKTHSGRIHASRSRPLFRAAPHEFRCHQSSRPPSPARPPDSRPAALIPAVRADVNQRADGLSQCTTRAHFDRTHGNSQLEAGCSLTRKRTPPKT